MLDSVRVAFKEHIRKAGTALVLNEEKVCFKTLLQPGPTQWQGNSGVLQTG